jgi:hypothetical protein
MRQALIIVMLIFGSLLSIIGYYMILMDWIQDIGEGVYKENYSELVFETLTLVLYTYLAVRFTRNNVHL